MQQLTIERMEPGNPDSLYRAEIGSEKYEGLTYQEAIEMMIRTDEGRKNNGSQDFRVMLLTFPTTKNKGGG